MRHFESTFFEQRTHILDRGAMLDVLAQAAARLVIGEHLIEDLVELAHVSLQVRRQRNRRSVARDAPAFAHHTHAIVEVVDAEVGDDEVEGGVGEWKR